MKQLSQSMSRVCMLIAAILIFSTVTKAQDTSVYKLRLNIPLADLPQNLKSLRHYPSMNQASAFSNDLYEVGFLGIDALGNKIFKQGNILTGNKPLLANKAFKYLLGLGFARYGSELPLPLGVWAHEEFHRALLAVNGIQSRNGNWILNRWDGSVYGVSDSALNHLKATDVNQLTYAYVAGVHSQIKLNQTITLDEFYKKRTLNKNALLLYNAWYVLHYFTGAVSPASDSAKVNIPQHEDRNPLMRDFAGDDLTAWAYDMFNPDSAYTNRPAFPGGTGVNRHIGFSDLSPETQSFLKKQKNLSLINFLNPAIFFINKIQLQPQLSFNVFAQYAPTHFGSDIAVYLPVQYKQFDLLLASHNYKGHNSRGHGYDVGILNYKAAKNIEADLLLHYWQQPSSFYASHLKTGFAAEAKASYQINNRWSAYGAVQQKTKGWLLGNPYLNHNVSMQVGFQYNVPK